MASAKGRLPLGLARFQDRILGEDYVRPSTTTERQREYKARRKEKNPEAVRAEINRAYWKRWEKLGFYEEDYERMRIAQNDRCAICNKAETQPPTGFATESEKKTRRLSIDHDHATGKVRGLLCCACNRLMGIVGESRVRIMAQYLNHRSSQ